MRRGILPCTPPRVGPERAEEVNEEKELFEKERAQARLQRKVLALY